MYEDGEGSRRSHVETDCFETQSANGVDCFGFYIRIKNETRRIGSATSETRRVAILQVEAKHKQLRTTRRSRGGAARGGGTPCATSRAWWSSAGWQRTFCRERRQRVRKDNSETEELPDALSTDQLQPMGKPLPHTRKLRSRLEHHCNHRPQGAARTAPWGMWHPGLRRAIRPLPTETAGQEPSGEAHAPRRQLTEPGNASRQARALRQQAARQRSQRDSRCRRSSAAKAPAVCPLPRPRRRHAHRVCAPRLQRAPHPPHAHPRATRPRHILRPPSVPPHRTLGMRDSSKSQGSCGPEESPGSSTLA